MPAVGIIRKLNIHVLTQLRLELFRVQLLLYNFTGWIVSFSSTYVQPVNNVVL